MATTEVAVAVHRASASSESDWWRNLDLRLNDYRDQWFAERTPGEVVPSADRREASGIDSLSALGRNPDQLFGAGLTTEGPWLIRT